MSKEFLFCKAIRACIRLKKAISLGLPTCCIDKLDAEMGACFDELEARNLLDEFLDYTLE